MYSIEGNDVFRDGEHVCTIDRAGFLNWMSADMQRFVSPVVKFLGEVARYDRETGMAVWIMPEVSAADPEEKTVKSEEITEKEEFAALGEDVSFMPEKRELCCMRDLVEVVERMTGESAPAFDPFYGDFTEEVVSWLNRHGEEIRQVRELYVFTGSLEKRRDF